jgi:hypothetical protein
VWNRFLKRRMEGERTSGMVRAVVDMDTVRLVDIVYAFNILVEERVQYARFPSFSSSRRESPPRLLQSCSPGPGAGGGKEEVAVQNKRKNAHIGERVTQIESPRHRDTKRPRKSGRFAPPISCPVHCKISLDLPQLSLALRGGRRMSSRIKEMVRVATARLGGEPSPRAGSSLPGRAESSRSRTARLGGGGASLRRQPQPQAPTVRTIYCNDRDTNAPVAYKVRTRPPSTNSV